MSEFRKYLEHGWKLVPILPGHKSPVTKGWQRRENAITNPDAAVTMRSAGLAHAYSGTCAIDVDDYPRAYEWLAERGVDLDALCAAPDAVQITSGRVNRAKLIYSLPEPLCSKKVALFGKNQSALDFRCATAAGMTVQDVLPPSIHPDTTKPYKWDYVDEMFGDWRDLPLIPDALHKIWLNELDAGYIGDEVPDKGASVEELRATLEYQDPDMNRDDWVMVGMAIHHETNGDIAGLELWNTWSEKSDKYKGRADLEASWRSFHDSPNSVTIGMLRQGVIATPEEFPDVTETTDEVDPWAAVAQDRRDRFRLVPIDEITQRNPPEWLVDELLPKTDLAMIYGAPSSGKSFVALDLAFSVAHGFTWFNRKTEAGSVVWIAAEAAGAMRNRARAYAQARGIDPATTDLHVVEQTLSLMSQDDVTALTDVLIQAMPKLIIVDTLAAASGGANENSGEDMNVVLTNCRKIHEETGALILLIHHSGKDASRGARGWSGLHAAVRAEFTVTHNADGDSPIRVLTVTKQNEGIAGIKLPFKLNVVALEWDNDVSSCVIEHLDESMLDSKDNTRLGGTQQIVFKIVYELANGQESAATLQDVYDEATVKMVKPEEGKRDTRSQHIKRAFESLVERGYISISNDQIKIGSTYDDDVPLSEV